MTLPRQQERFHRFGTCVGAGLQNEGQRGDDCVSFSEKVWFSTVSQMREVWLSCTLLVKKKLSYPSHTRPPTRTPTTWAHNHHFSWFLGMLFLGNSPLHEPFAVEYFPPCWIVAVLSLQDLPRQNNAQTHTSAAKMGLSCLPGPHLWRVSDYSPLEDLWTQVLKACWRHRMLAWALRSWAVHQHVSEIGTWGRCSTQASWLASLLMESTLFAAMGLSHRRIPGLQYNLL